MPCDRNQANVLREAKLDLEFEREMGRKSVGRKRHWCKEFDFMPIDDSCPEIDACVCYEDGAEDN